MKHLTLDIETSGLPQKGHTYEKNFMDYPYIVSIAWKIDSENVAEVQATKEFIINQEGRKIPTEATAIHGITNEMAAASTDTLVIVLMLLLEFGTGAELVIGHNLYFDISIIKANILRLKADGKGPEDLYDRFTELLHKDKRIDTMMKTTKFCNIPGKYGPKWPKLTELYAKLFDGETFESHSSKHDVDATYKCFKKLRELGVL